MKLLLPVALASLLLCQCASSGGGPPLRGYKLGKMKGGADAAAGLSRTPSRYESEYNAIERDAFFRGYEKGYDSGGR